MNTTSYITALISTLIFLTTITGTWDFTVDSPEGPVKGELIFTQEGDILLGKIITLGQEYSMTDLELVDDQLSFKTNAAGYYSTIKGIVKGDIFDAKVSVEGMQLPLKATKR